MSLPLPRNGSAVARPYTGAMLPLAARLARTAAAAAFRSAMNRSATTGCVCRSPVVHSLRLPSFPSAA